MAHDFRGFSPWTAASKTGTSWEKGVAEEDCSTHGGQEIELGTVPAGKGPGAIWETQGHASRTHYTHPQVAPKPIKLTAKLHGHVVDYRKQ